MKSVVMGALAALLMGLLAGWAAAYYQYGGWQPQYQFAKADLEGTAESASVMAPPRLAERARVFVEGDTTYDFGVMGRNEKREHTFVIRNRGNLELSLDFRDKSCQCTEVNVSRNTIPPGETADVRLVWQPTTLHPEFQQTARFTTNDPAHRELDLTIKGRVQQVLELHPTALIWSDLAIGQGHAAPVDLLSFHEAPLLASRVEFTSTETARWFSADIGPLPEDVKASKPGVTAGNRITFHLQPGLGLGPFQQRVRIYLNEAEREPVELIIQGAVRGNVSFFGTGFNEQAQRWELGTLAGAGPHEKQLLLMIKGEEHELAPLKIVSVDPAEALEVTISPPTKLARSLRYTLKVKIDGHGRAINRLGTQQGAPGKITLETPFPDLPTIDIPITFATESNAESP